jgi:hypothetical protein
MLEDPQAVEGFRHQLWSHDLGISESDVAGWAVSGFIAHWDRVAKANELLKATSEKMAGEGVIPFDPTTVKGKLSDIPDILSEVHAGEVGETDEFEEAGEWNQWSDSEQYLTRTTSTSNIMVFRSLEEKLLIRRWKR